MKKLLILMVLVFGISLGLAQGNRSAFGLYVLGAQYTLDTGAVDLRLGAGLPLLFFGSGGGTLLSGSLDLLFPMGLVGSSARWYLGAGSEVYLVLGGGGGGAVFTPRGFANFEFGGDGVSFFIEGGLQGVVAVGGGSVFGASVLIPHVRLGVNFR
ncbi:hypothetical protein [Meiothermus hypogaeus]|uniref:Outer membrane protein beta-barrel domain-containing protein n=2 Tax=Meiothermus hypogaeus TaxID=884155 RepID=A0A511R6I4_9DEIN|nr:hypothetical protein [Meiothermus hypogaeus]RIH74341.1 hypothetical protein Mhypo_03399 [Meiothermus hypogaeus]GEM85224.1 hypothetical protein MHY01S_33900 [Meiothermus hypogaeus NBRC 106114]